MHNYIKIIESNLKENLLINKNRKGIYLYPSLSIKEGLKKQKNKSLIKTKNKIENSYDLLKLSNFNPDDIKSLDIDKLETVMLKGMYVLKAALFSQAGFEYKRIEHLRDFLGGFENEVFNEDYLEELTPLQKLKLYGLASENMHNSMNFLLALQKSATNSLDTIQAMKERKTKSLKSDNVEELNPNKEKVKNILMNILKKKVKNEESE